MNEEFHVSARYETDVFEEAAKNSLVTTVEMTELEQNNFSHGEDTINKNLPNCGGLQENDTNLSENSKENHDLSTGDSKSNKIEEELLESSGIDISVSGSCDAEIHEEEIEMCNRDPFKQDLDKNISLTNNEAERRESNSKPTNTSHKSQKQSNYPLPEKEMIDHFDDLEYIFMLPNNNKNENIENEHYPVDGSHNGNGNLENTWEDICPEFAEPTAPSLSEFSDVGEEDEGTEQMKDNGQISPDIHGHQCYNAENEEKIITYTNTSLITEENHEENFQCNNMHSNYESSLLSLEIEQHMVDVEIISTAHDTVEHIQETEEESLTLMYDLDLLFRATDLKDSEESSENIDTNEETSVIDFLLDENDNEEYLGNDILDQEEHRRMILNPDPSLEIHNDEISKTFPSLNLKTVGFPKFGLHFYNSLQTSFNKEYESLTMGSNPLVNQDCDGENDNNNELQGTEFEKFSGSHDFKVNPLFDYNDDSLNQEDIVDADNDDEDDSLVHAVDIIKDFFGQMNIKSPVEDHKDRIYFNDCESDVNNPFFEFYLNDQIRCQTNGLDCPDDALINVSGVKSPIINLESIEEEQEEDVDHEENISVKKEVDVILDEKKMSENYDSHDHIKILNQEEFPSNDCSVELRHEQLDEKENIGVSHCMNNNKSASHINKRDLIDDQYKTIDHGNNNKYNEIDDSDNQWAMLESNDVNDLYINSNEKISAMNFLLDDGQDDLDMEEFFPAEVSHQERRTGYSGEQDVLLPNSIFTPYKLDLFSNHNFGNSSLWDKDGYSDTSSETSSIESIKYIEDIDEDILDEDDTEIKEHSFISDLLHSLINKTIFNLDCRDELGENEFIHLPFRDDWNDEDDIFCESPMDDFDSDTSSEKGMSTDEGIVATSDEEKDSEKDLKNINKLSNLSTDQNTKPYYHTFDTLY